MVKGKKNILAWYGQEQPPTDHLMAEDGDILLCHGHGECATDLVWLKHVMVKCGRGKKMLELFSNCGMSQSVKYACTEWCGVFR